jgi:hypothetical protein
MEHRIDTLEKKVSDIERSLARIDSMLKVLTGGVLGLVVLETTLGLGHLALATIVAKI